MIRTLFRVTAAEVSQFRSKRGLCQPHGEPEITQVQRGLSAVARVKPLTLPTTRTDCSEKTIQQNAMLRLGGTRWGVLCKSSTLLDCCGWRWAYSRVWVRMFVLRNRCCSSAATSRRHCFRQRILHHSVQLCDRLTTNTVRCPCDEHVREESPQTSH